MSEIIVLATTFISVLIVSVVVIQIINSRRQIAARLDVDSKDDEEEIEIPQDIRGLPMSEATLVEHYYTVIRTDNNPNSVDNRLIRAGFFHPGTAKKYQALRIAIVILVSFLVMFAVPLILPELASSALIMIALFSGALVFLVCNIVLEKIGDSSEIIYRRLFPDFMDTLIVCVDAGMSVEAAIDRVSKEFLRSSNKGFGLHLAIMMLEVRGGRLMRDALTNFAKRLRIDEALSLAILFRQSEELGASVTTTLRVFSQEMRDKRMIAAEEKANSLPFKMLFPLALFLFPISLLIVAIPVVMKVISVLNSLAA